MSAIPLARVAQTITVARTALNTISRKMVPAPVALLELATGFMTIHVLYALGRLGIADELRHGPLPPTAVADRVGTNHDATHRLLRACVMLGILREDRQSRFGLTKVGELLRSDVPGSMLPVILLLGDPRYQGPWGHLPGTVRTGTAAAAQALGQPMWDYLERDPEFAATFNAAMTRLSALDWPAVKAAYDFARFGTIIDIGGGHGQLLAQILAVAPLSQGVLVERAAVVAEATGLLREAGVMERCRLEVGSFFEVVPTHGDLYVMRRVIHDFDDAGATRILTNLRHHMPRGATLLLLESVVPPGSTPHFAKLLDLDVMLFVEGRERTEREFATLLAQSGFSMSRVIPTMSTISLVEATVSEES